MITMVNKAFYGTLALLFYAGGTVAAAAPQIELNDIRYPHSNEPIHANSHFSQQQLHQSLQKSGNPIDRPAAFDVELYQLDIAVDPHFGTISGTVTLDLKLAPGAEIIQLDAVDMAIGTVALDGTETAAFYDGEVLSVALASPAQGGELVQLAIDYEARQPQNLRITGPDATDPERMIAAYTYTQPLGSRYWFPCLDRPSDKALAEIRIEVPEGFNALSNGNMIERRRSITGEVFAYRMDQPVAPYLMSLAIGQYEIYNIGSYQGKPLYVWTPEKIKDRTLAETSGTEKMMEVFSDFTGTEYPFPLYSQSVAQAWGSSMEHQSATTMGGMRITGDMSGEGVVAHELAHQWFGDYVTCEIWEELWLNEGFASYLPMVYFTQTGKRSDALGYFDWWRDGYFTESEFFVRALSTDNIAPGEIFDSHSYEKGALIIHMMRTLANQMPSESSYQDNFTQALELYFTKHGLGNVRYQYLQAALEEVTGTSWQPFFTQWVRSPGHPILGVSHEVDGDGQLLLTVEQKQATRDDRQWRTFSFPLEVEVIMADGRTSTYKIDIYDAKMTIPLSTGGDVAGVVVNPQWIIPAQVNVDQGLDGWMAVLTHSRYEKARLFASRQIAKSLQETEAPARYVDQLTRERSLYVVGDAVAALSANTANRDHVNRLIGQMSLRLDLDRIALSTIARAETWLVKTAEDAPTRDDEVRWQAEFEASSIQAVRAAILDRLAHADLERTQSFVLNRFQESHWSSRDRRAMIDIMTTTPTPTSADFVQSALEGKLSVYWLTRALSNLASANFDSPDQVDLMITGAKNHRYSYGRYSFVRLLAKQVSSKEEVCPVLEELAEADSTPDWSTTTYSSIKSTAKEALNTLDCE